MSEMADRFTVTTPKKTIDSRRASLSCEPPLSHQVFPYSGPLKWPGGRGWAATARWRGPLSSWAAASRLSIYRPVINTGGRDRPIVAGCTMTVPAQDSYRAWPVRLGARASKIAILASDSDPCSGSGIGFAG